MQLLLTEFLEEALVICTLRAIVTLTPDATFFGKWNTTLNGNQFFLLQRLQRCQGLQSCSGARPMMSKMSLTILPIAVLVPNPFEQGHNMLEKTTA